MFRIAVACDDDGPVRGAEFRDTQRVGVDGELRRQANLFGGHLDDLRQPSKDTVSCLTIVSAKLNAGPSRGLQLRIFF